jgi:signal peptidase II
VARRPGGGWATAIVVADVATWAARREDAAVSDQPDPPARPRRSRARLLLGLAAVVLALDVASKLLVVATIDRGENVRVLGGLVYLTHARNTGAAFSFAEGATVAFTLIAAAVVVVIVRSARRLFSTAWAIALALVLGGAVGNLLDRVFRDPGFLRGGVVDWISVFGPDGKYYPIFNLADSAIVCGGVLGAVLAFRGIEFGGGRSRDGAADGSGDAADSSDDGATVGD